ncbi:MAG: O-antigen ligase family protein, partial [Vicinamibacterales bacterium]
LVPLGALAALGGAHPSATMPILAAAAAAFLVSGAGPGLRDARLLDAALAALAAGAVLQVMPMPTAALALLSPHVEGLRATLSVDPAGAPATLSVDPRLTRGGLASLVSALLVFWAAREAFGRGGLGVAAGALAAMGFATTMVAFVQQATAPDLLLWTWRPVDPGSRPIGPFVNRNHFATWLLMAASVTAAYLAARAGPGRHEPWSLRLRVRDWLADGWGLLLAAALVAMLVGLVATLSRAAILGAGAALTIAATLAARTGARGRVARLAAAAVAVLLSLAVWSNRDALARKFEAATTTSRVTIWRETLPIIRDFGLAGTGVGTYGHAMLRYQRPVRDVHFNQAHSEYLQLAAEGGLLLLAPAIVALVAGLRLARQRIREDTRGTRWLRIGAAAGLAGVAVQGLFETGLRVPANGLLAAVLAAILVHQVRQPIESRGTDTTHRRG